MNIPITGGAGFIGSHLTERMLADGHEVTIIDDFNTYDVPEIKGQHLSVVWKIKDGKRGHENQSQGLIQALGQLRPIECIEVDVRKNGSTWLDYFFGRRANFSGLPKPDLILGTGSQTHATILAAGRATGAPTIVLMAPPRWISSFFDLCIIPEHDDRDGSNIVTTKGVLNLIRPNQQKSSSRGLFLIGGASKHHGWDCQKIMSQMSRIIERSPEIQWTATTSRRSPKETCAEISAIKTDNINVVPVEQTDGSWLPKQLSQSSYVWVTEDSVSMIYEALSSGAKVGVLEVPRKVRSSRVIRGIDLLLERHEVMPYQLEQCDLADFDPPAALNEAERVAQIIHEKFF